MEAEDEATELLGPAENADLGGAKVSFRDEVENVADGGAARAGEMGVDGWGRKWGDKAGEFEPGITSVG